MLIESLRADSLLSFAPGSSAIALHPLNVIIGPNGSGKSNLIEVIELLRALPTGLASAVREGGGVREWLWKGGSGLTATVEAHLRDAKANWPLRYQLGFTTSGARLEIVEELLEDNSVTLPKRFDPGFYYRFQAGEPILNVREEGSPPKRVQHLIKRRDLVFDESILFQRKDPYRYSELTWLASQFTRIQTFREWSFGRTSALRQPQSADLPTNILLPDARNLGLILNQLEHSDAAPELKTIMGRFLPRFDRMSTLVQAGTVQFYLHEMGLKTPVPATRLSDGTLRFLAMAALLLMPSPPPLICLEEPELGLHPDAMALVAEMLVAASARTQIIVTTHSDALVSALSDHVESVLVCEHLASTQFKRLEMAQLSHWLESYRLGDLWRMGELGGNP